MYSKITIMFQHRPFIVFEDITPKLIVRKTDDGYLYILRVINSDSSKTLFVVSPGEWISWEAK